jgi:antitoxin component YwqK of YwqJK toxin-antitoxin module
MKRYILLLLGLTFLFSCKDNTTNSTSASFDTTGYEIVKIDGDITKAIKRDGAGAKIEEGYLKNGLKNGAWMTYQEGGRLETVSSWIDGKKFGMEVQMNKLLHLVEMSNYENDLLNGFHGKYKNTRPREEAFFSSDKLHGTIKIYYETGREQGKLRQTVDYKNGVVDGFVRHYNPEGEMTLEYTYKNGERTGGGMIAK